MLQQEKSADGAALLDHRIPSKEEPALPQICNVVHEIQVTAAEEIQRAGHFGPCQQALLEALSCIDESFRATLQHAWEASQYSEQSPGRKANHLDISLGAHRGRAWDVGPDQADVPNDGASTKTTDRLHLHHLFDCLDLFEDHSNSVDHQHKRVSILTPVAFLHYVLALCHDHDHAGRCNGKHDLYRHAWENHIAELLRHHFTPAICHIFAILLELRHILLLWGCRFAREFLAEIDDLLVSRQYQHSRAASGEASGAGISGLLVRSTPIHSDAHPASSGSRILPHACRIGTHVEETPLAVRRASHLLNRLRSPLPICVDGGGIAIIALHVVAGGAGRLRAVLGLERHAPRSELGGLCHESQKARSVHHGTAADDRGAHAATLGADSQSQCASLDDKERPIINHLQGLVRSQALSG
mmetsp:Transcript_43675/g.78931  ORF Transcript_43675/g.78931 Transcript_43675/m.78931 type:complete len:415 (-) Transcript_43675:579-1823(-)